MPGVYGYSQRNFRQTIAINFDNWNASLDIKYGWQVTSYDRRFVSFYRSIDCVLKNLPILGLLIVYLGCGKLSEATAPGQGWERDAG